MVTGRKSACRFAFVALAFSNALDDVNGDWRIKIGNDLCTFVINLVRLYTSNSGVNTTEMCISSVDRHSS